MNVNQSPSGTPAIVTGVIASFDAADNPALVITVQSVPVPEARVGDIVMVVPTPGIADLSFGPGVCAVAGTALIPVTNPTAGAINPAAQAYRYVIFRGVSF